ncbi:L-ribulose-5-phosphate 3-epimerase [Lactobacillus sp. ESL0731]|uniref:L-ribulose-5-phosphate 3-epimerase n=1 Tax=unclassified Lactobacillus TaxID=2620435 RepID=UPI0023F85A44|nr:MULTISPECIES: L-ribulose-5-phosphate 3-epimerase [unclassified Lactobacillus]WEV51311.1 L-ribulose-5-phosphate 3-epimerase [Lactobacillus sp. ESL0700]WEV62441.1 L-ribulose-5-phosphate 3-epimerase [Lactobacillus sp. ESL0731]
MTVNSLGIYEKALPQNLSWEETFNLVHQLGFNFLEFSIDESDKRLARLDWTHDERKKFRDLMWSTNTRINNLMLSGHRRFPLGSADPDVRKKSLEMMSKAVDLCVDLGIHNIQMAGYDVYYEKKTDLSREYYVENLIKCVHMAAKKNIMLSIETMDDPFINNLSKIAQYHQLTQSPWLQAYPDLGNLSAWPENDVPAEIENYIDTICAIHLKDSKKVTPDFKGQFKNVPFGTGCVDFVGLLRELVRLNYNGSFTIEMWSGDNGDENALEEVEAAKTFFDKIFAQVGITQEAVE